MKMNFKQKYLVEDVRSFICSEVTHVVIGKGADTRAKHFLGLIENEYKGKILQLDVDVRNHNHLTVDQIVDGKVRQIGTGYLVHHLEHYVRELMRGSSVCIDISGIKHQLLFFLLKVIRKVGVARLFAVYTEPQRYEKTDFDEDQYWLTEDFLGIRPAPGYAKSLAPQDHFILVSILGFEGNRFQAIFDHLQPLSNRIIPIVGFPAFKPGWKGIALAANRAVLETTGCAYELQYCNSACPFDVYERLRAIRTSFPSAQLVIAPLGPRPLTLGCAFYLLRDANCLLTYDNPVERKYRTLGVEKCHFYHVTHLLDT